MSAKGAYVLVSVEEFGEPETRLWCAACRLPSGIEAPYMLMLDGKPDCLFRFRTCLDCGRDLSGPPAPYRDGTPG
jgi:hypothetical protein